MKLKVCQPNFLAHLVPSALIEMPFEYLILLRR